MNPPNLEVVLQKEEDRVHEDAPEWAFFPHLRLLLGWGFGVWETLGDSIAAARTIFVLEPPVSRMDEVRGALLELHDWIDDYDKGRSPMPFYARVVGDARCVLIACNGTARAFAGPASHSTGATSGHGLEADESYRLLHGWGQTSHAPCVALQARSKRLKAEFQAKRLGLGLPIEPGSGFKRRGPGGTRDRRSENEQAYAAWISAYKAEIVERRVKEMREDPSSRPPRFDIVQAKHLRARDQEIARGKKGQDGKPKRPYTEAELLEATINSIADKEAVDATFDYSWSDVFRLTEYGIYDARTIAEAA